ncbi:hypothetical protein BST81_12485 [Leptolyngbya sp. 'hensonii']|nr:hypothetical protein BST81_12485 [Leptolyngbya sp. 'hensonii']
MVATTGCAGLKLFAPIGPTAQTGQRVALFNPAIKVISIEQVRQQKQFDAVVYLTGTAGRQVPLLGSTVYELQDSTGSVWVLTSAAAPKSGSQVRIQAIVRNQAITLAGQAAPELYVEEQEQLTDTGSPPATLGP